MYGKRTVGQLIAITGCRCSARHAADREEPGLRRFGQEERLVADLRRQRHGQHALVDVRLDLLAARAQAHFDLGLLLGQ